MALTSRLSPIARSDGWSAALGGESMTMIPSSLIAGFLVGIANDLWLAVVSMCFSWSLVFCVYISMLDTRRKTATISHLESTGKKAHVGHVTYFSVLFHRI